MRHYKVSALALAALAAAVGTVQGAAEGYLRYPDLHGDRVVFVAESDLWIAPAGGGTARRLTTHVGGETFPKFSPDGKWIAFSGQYDGNADVYVVSSDGGEPRRLTWHPAPDLVDGWTPDGKSVLFTSPAEHPLDSPEMFAVPARGGDIEKLPIGWATNLDIESDGGRFAFTRTGGGGTWKRYRGGTAQSIWVGSPKLADHREVSRFDGMNAYPMWHRGRIYHLADIGGTANLWSMSPDGGDLRQHTRFDEWDARYPSMAPDGRIAFMLSGDIHVFDPGTGRESKLAIELPSDRVLTRSRYPNAAQYLTWFQLSSDGDRLAVTTRGEIFSVPVKKGVTLPITRGSGARESWGSFDSTGKRLVYVTDETREEEIRSIDAWGRDEPATIERAESGRWHFPPVYAPDGQHVAYADQTQTLYVVPVGQGAARKVDRSEQAPITDYVWSPDSRWLAYTKQGRTDYASLYVWDASSGTVQRITGGDTDETSPAWDPEGRYLYFLSHRYTNPLLGARDLENVDIEPTKVFLALLRKDGKNPFAASAGLPPDETKEADDPKATAKKQDEAEEEEKGKKDASKDEPAKPVEIDFDGIGDRIVGLPVQAGQYGNLSATKSHVFWISTPLQGMADWGPLFGGPQEPRSTLVSFDLDAKKEQPFLAGVSAYDLSVQANKLAIVKGPGEIYVVAVGPPPADLSDARVDLSGVVVEVDPRDEWAQIYFEGWRHMRDFYWDPGLGGVDWNAVRDQYATLLPRLSTRADLLDLMAEMIGELSTSHTYVFGGDFGTQVPQRPTGLLGADVSRHGKSFRIDRIYRGAPADNERSPLLEPGVGVSEGDYILAIQHQPFRDEAPFHAHLEGRAGTAVLLTVNDRPEREGARDVVVETLTSESGIRYADWVRRNREYVAQKTDGKIGYVHVPDMMSAGLIEFNTWFYPQLDRAGMIVDMRWNGGGFVSQMILERFRRPIVSFDRSRGGGVSTYPYRTLNGPFVVLTNEHAGSDGDIFPAAVQLEGLAPVIGKRSWGGVVGINSLRPMVDGGILTQPSAAWWDPKRGWDLENHGVDPDIVVENLPQELARGVDAQLDRGIAEVLRLHAERPPLDPRFGPARPRGRDAFRGEIAEHGAQPGPRGTE